MAVTLTINGTAKSYPNGTDEEWGEDATAAMVALADPANTLYVNSIVNDDTTGGTAVPASAEIVKTHGTEIDAVNKLTTNGDVLYYGSGAYQRLAKGSDSEVLTLASGVPSWAAAGGGGSKPDFQVNKPAGSFDYPVANPAPLNTDTGSNINIKAHLFDDTTDEGVLGTFVVPSDATTGGTVLFEAIGYAGAGVAAKTVALGIEFSSKAAGETWDTAFGTPEVSSPVIHATTDQLEAIDWSETFSNLGWAVGDQVQFRLFRDVSADDLASDYSLTHFRIRIPRT